LRDFIHSQFVHAELRLGWQDIDLDYGWQSIGYWCKCSITVVRQPYADSDTETAGKYVHDSPG